MMKISGLHGNDTACILVRRNCGRKLFVSIKCPNPHSFKKGVILSCRSIIKTRQISYLHGSALFTIPLGYRSCCFNDSTDVVLS